MHRNRLAKSKSESKSEADRNLRVEIASESKSKLESNLEIESCSRNPRQYIEEAKPKCHVCRSSAPRSQPGCPASGKPQPDHLHSTEWPHQLQACSKPKQSSSSSPTNTARAPLCPWLPWPLWASLPHWALPGLRGSAMGPLVPWAPIWTLLGSLGWVLG